jgi:hypothetical protein
MVEHKRQGYSTNSKDTAEGAKTEHVINHWNLFHVAKLFCSREIVVINKLITEIWKNALGWLI